MRVGAFSIIDAISHRRAPRVPRDVPRVVGAVVLCAALLFTSTLAPRAADVSGIVQQHLYDGSAKAAEAELSAARARDPGDADLAFALGTVRFIRAVEHLGQSLYRYGLRAPAIGIPIVRMPVPPNPRPEALTYDGFRRILQDLVDDLGAADRTLAETGERPVRLQIDPARIRLDITGDGGKREDERLWVIVRGMSPALTRDADTAVVLDKADVAWLRGYANLLAGFTEWWLAHDFSAQFEATFGLFFPRAGAAEAMGREEDLRRPSLTGVPRGDTVIADAITFVHLMHWPVAEPTRMRAARAHLLEVIAMSRASWAAVLARSDDERHWIPGPGKKGIVALPVTRERIDAWFKVLDEGEAVLEGRKLLPHWRFTRGIDLKRVFEQPRTFDLVLWFTGPGAQPFLADGEVISTRSTDALLGAFEGNFLTYALWFN